ncbi:MAG: PAS domain-containing protein, partial [Xanthomonadales bacterium]|nr:PAS domain-containing protein [Xanthomonadales bacterium]
VDMHSTPLREGDGSVTAVLSVTRDVTERRIAAENERALLHELDAERARLVVAQRIGRIGNWESDLRSGSVFWSEEMHRIFETNPVEFQPNLKSLLLRVHAEDRDAAERAFKESLRHPGGEFRIEHCISVGSGRLKHVEQRWEVVGENGRAHLVFGTSRDISEQHAAARALQLEHERLLEAQRVARMGSWEFDLATGHADASEQMHRLFETDPATHQPTFDDFLSRLHEDDRALLLASWQRSITDPARAEALVQYRVPFADGRIKFMEARWQVFGGTDGAPARVLGTVRDITEQRLAEAAERRSNALLAAIAENMPNQLVVKDLDLRCVYINELGLQLIGKSRAEILGRPVTDFMPPEQGALLEAHDREVLDSGQRVTHERTYSFGGNERVFLSTKAPLRDADGAIIGIIGVSREITERKHFEAQLQRSEERFREMAENVSDVFYNYDPAARRMLYMNPAFERVFGRPLAEIRDNPHAYMDCVHPDDIEAVLAAFDAQLRGERNSSEFRILRPDGEVRWVHQHAEPIVAADRRVERIVGSMRDTTARKLADARLRQSLTDLDQRNKELREFAFVASHDLQEPLRKIRAFSELVVSRYREALPEPGRDYLDRMHQAAGRMQVLIDDLLEYSRINTGGARFRDVDLAQVCKDVLNDLEQRIRASDAKLRVAPLPHLRADPTQMRQLLQNLLANALKFRREGVRPEIAVVCSLIDLDGVPGVRIEVADNGIGFEQEHAERIFAPFQRLHSRSEYEGSGIGLAIVRRIVARHRGRIQALGTPGAGARFIIDLPSALDAPDTES